ncbi:MAG TPA: MgtC/SapB family protein [Candidatus Binatia bacterium]|nr:MgtC/SapB family protein [Candidatus Binatia bacterium]
MSFSEPFPHTEVAVRIAVSLGVGLLVGLEREWAHKEIGVRTFAITALLGALATMLDPSLLVAALLGALLLVAFVNVQSLLRDRSLELTTSVALLVTLLLGALTGLGHFFTAVTSAIAMTMLLAWKLELARFAGDLQPEEIRSAVLLGLLSFVIYPLLPDRFVDPWALLNPREAWVMVVVIAGIGFGNYWLLRLYGPRGTYYAAFLGGLVNSTAATAELTRAFDGKSGTASLAVPVLLVTVVAMFARNLLILAIFAPAAVRLAAPPLATMALAVSAWVWLRADRARMRTLQLGLSSPVSLGRVLGFAVIFLVIASAGTLVQRYFGGLGFLLLSAVGGVVSSASTTATAAALVVARRITPETAAVAAVLTSVASAFANLPVVYWGTKDRGVLRGLAGSSTAVVLLGLGVLALAWRGW